MFEIFGTKDPQKALLRANEYIKEGKVDAAIKTLESNLTQATESFDLYLELARLYFESEQRARTVEILRQAKSFAPSKIDEIIALISGLFYTHPAIDAGDFLLQLYIEKEDYDQIFKVMGELSEREVNLLLTRYEKIKQGIENKNIIVKKDIENVLIFASLRFFLNQSEAAIAALESIISLEVYAPTLLKWSRTVVRERFGDPNAAILILKIELASQEFVEAIDQAQRIMEKFPDYLDPLIAVIEPVKPPPEVEATFAQFLTELYIKKGDFDKSLTRLQQLVEKDPKKIDDVIKGLRELARAYPKNLKILYATGDTYLKADKVSHAMSEFNKILEIDPSQVDSVLQRYQKAFEREPSNPLVIQSLVSSFLKKDDVNSAVGVIENAFRSDPGFIDEYISNLNTILDKNLNNTKALYLLGLCYAHKGDKENALVIFDSLMENNEFDYVGKATKALTDKYPDDLEYLNLRARSYALQGKQPEALQLITSYLKLRPEATVRILPTLDLIINRRPDLAPEIIPLYEKAREVESFFAELAIARACAFTGDYTRSVQSFEKCLIDEKQKATTKRALIEVIKEKPDALPLLLTAARVFLKEGEVELATQFFKTAQLVDPKAFFEIVDEFYDALKTFPKDRGVRILLIDTYYNRKVWVRVIEEAKRAIEVFGHDGQYFNLKLGQALVESGALSDAVRPLMLSLDGPENYSKEVINYLDKILQVDKSNIPAHVARGRALSKAHRIDEAVEEFLMTARIVPSRGEYILKELNQLSSKAMANPQIVFAMGRVEIPLKKYDDAIRHLLHACELEPTIVKKAMPLLNQLAQEFQSPLLDFSLARIHQLANLKSSAIKYYIKSQAQDKAFREPAIAALKRICAENPGDLESRKGLAQIYFDHNNLEDALDSAREIYNLDPKEGNWAKTFIASILQKNSQHIPSYYFLGYVLLNENNHKNAIEVYKKLTELAPTEITKIVSTLEGIQQKTGELSIYLGTLFKTTGEISKAITLFDQLFANDTSFGEAIIYQIKEILLKNTDFGEAYLLASKIFTHQKEYDRAIEAIKHAQELMPANSDIVLKEGQLYYEMGRIEDAIKIYTELLEKSKDRKAIYRLIKKTRDQYFKEKIALIKGEDDDNRLKRAPLYLLMGDVVNAEKELQFIPHNNLAAKYHTLLRAKIHLKKSRPIDALEIMKDLPVDKDTALVYADIYEAIGSFEAAAMVLRQASVEGVEPRIDNYEKLSQERRLAKGRYLIEGRS